MGLSRQVIGYASRPDGSGIPKFLEVVERSRSDVLACLDDEALPLAETVQARSQDEHRRIIDNISVVKNVLRGLPDFHLLPCDPNAVSATRSVGVSVMLAVNSWMAVAEVIASRCCAVTMSR
jgi:hypothetical protein